MRSCKSLNKEANQKFGKKLIQNLSEISIRFPVGNLKEFSTSCCLNSIFSSMINVIHPLLWSRLMMDYFLLLMHKNQGFI